jgi:hypothetical protein
MRGDFSRIRFNPAKHYSAVLEQQGRVALDADGNEQIAIDTHLRETTNVDVIGPYGGPENDAGFEIDVVGSDIQIGAGRYYVEGLLVENATPVLFDNQPFSINPPYTSQQILNQIAAGKGTETAHLELQVWERLVTQLDDPCLREPALGQADTTARLQTVWRVVATLSQGTSPFPGRGPLAPRDRLESKAAAATSATFVDPVTQLSPCCQGLYKEILPFRTGAMGADSGQGNNTCGCQPIPSAGYQGLENQLYRVEIHTGGTLDTATFKWSRENGSVVTAITAYSGPVVTVSSLGPDANLGYQAGQWVEISDDSNLFGDPPNQPGTLYQIQSIGPGPLQVTLTSPLVGIDQTRNARMRRWDQSGAGATAAGVNLSGSAIPLENGIEVTFHAGTYVAGDYWTIPARTSDGSIEWPPCGGSGDFFQPAKFIPVYSAPLACIHLRNIHFAAGVKATFNLSPFLVDDCRLTFPPLTALNQQQVSAALHVSAISWNNDDVMTVDTLLQNGLSITLDQAPTCPWGGGNFKVTLEPPLANDAFAGAAEALKALAAAGKIPDRTDVFMRTVVALDPPGGITVNGNQVIWLPPPVTQGLAMYSTYWLDVVLNTALVNANTGGFGRVRVQLIGSSVYSDSGNGTLYLDGESFGATATRSSDGSQCVSLQMPSGGSAVASDFEGWFYLAPTVLIANVQIQGIENGVAQPLSAVTVNVNSQGVMTGLETGPAGATPTPVTAVQALITLTYLPIAPTVVTLSLTGNGVGTVVNIQGTATVPAGQLTVTVPINITASPGVNAQGVGNTDTVTLNASVSSVVGNRSFSPAPSLAITGGPIPIIIFK